MERGKCRQCGQEIIYARPVGGSLVILEESDGGPVAIVAGHMQTIEPDSLFEEVYLGQRYRYHDCQKLRKRGRQ